MAPNNSPMSPVPNSAPPQALPDVPPHIFLAFQTLEKALEKTTATRQEHAESERALQMLFQHSLEGHKASRELAAYNAAKQCEVPRDVDVAQVVAEGMSSRIEKKTEPVKG